MTKLAVDPKVYFSASNRFHESSSDAEGALLTLRSALRDSLGMAGSDAAGREWAGGYDECAESAAEALTEVTASLSHLAGLLRATGRNYAEAEAASGGAAPEIPPLPAPIRPAEPDLPTAAGGTDDGPFGWSLVAGLVGYAWPNGHQDKLHAADRAWSTVADKLTTTADTADSVATEVAGQDTPEAPAAGAACQTGAAAARELSDVSRSIGRSCREYAGHLDHAHSEMISILTELAIETAAIEVAAAAGAVFTAGLDEIPAQAAVAARIATAVAKIRPIIETLIAAARTAAGTIRALGTRATEVLGKARGLLGLGARRAETVGVEGGARGAAELNALYQTDRDTTFFWSGRTSEGVGVGPKSETDLGIAAGIAEERGGVTLESYQAKNQIELPPWGDGSNAAIVGEWEAHSAAYANSASGEVRVVIGSNLRPGNIWETVELPRLQANPNVTRITTIDPETGVETIIFQR